MAISESWIAAHCNAASVLENVTPYKLCVYLFIQEYAALKKPEISASRIKRNLFPNSSASSKLLLSVALKPIYKRDFCMLVLHLMQNPDMEFKDLIKIINSDKYHLPQELLDNFKKQLSMLMNIDVGCFIDVICGRGNDSSSSSESGPFGKAGVFMKRIRLYFEKLSFDLTVEVHRNLQSYISDCVDIKKIKDIEQECTNSNFINTPMVDSSHVANSSSAMDMDLSNIQLHVSLGAISPIPSIPNIQVDSKCVHQESKDKDEDKRNIKTRLWSKHQVELFVSQQAKLIQEDPSAAMSPPELQKTIKQVLSNNPDHASAHYLSYLNCVRCKELNGALESLCHYFERKQVNSKKGYRPHIYQETPTDNVVNLRLAALNLGILYTLFNKPKEAECSFNEALSLSHDSNDNVCLQYAQTWLYKLSEDNKEVMIEKALAKSMELNMNYLLSFGYQAYAQSVAIAQSPPANVFQLLSRSESLSFQYVMVDLVGVSLTQRAALWSLYGRPDLASISAQLLLALANPASSSEDSPVINSESIIIALSVLIQYFAIKGDYNDAHQILEFNKSMSDSNQWVIWSEGQLIFTECLHKGSWQQANLAVNQLALVDKVESLLRQAELLLAKGEKKAAHKAGLAALSESKNVLSQVRALRLIAKSDPSSSLKYLTRALYTATSSFLDYYKNLITLDILSIQVDMGLPGGKVSEDALLNILSHGSFSDASDSLLLCAKGYVSSGDLSAALPLLDDAQSYAKKICDFARVKNIAFIQAVICDKLGMISHRNKYAFQFRNVDEQFPCLNSSLPLM